MVDYFTDTPADRRAAANAISTKAERWSRAFAGLKPLPKLMTAPPTLSVGAAAAVSAITGAANSAVVIPPTSDYVSRNGGVWSAADAFYQVGSRPFGGRVDFTLDGRRFEVRMKTFITSGNASSRGFSILCDGEVVSRSQFPAGVRNNSDHLVLVDFGADTETYRFAEVAVVNGGSGYLVGDTIVVSGGTSVTPAQFIVLAVSSGVVTALGPHVPGDYSALPSYPAAQASTSGSGTGCTFNITWTKVHTTYKTRQISLIFDKSTWFGGLNVDTNAVVSPIPDPTWAPRLLHAGDSITEGAYSEAAASAYPVLLGQMLGGVSNWIYGVSGLGFLVAVSGQNFGQRSSAIIAANPDMLHINLGTNDFLGGVSASALAVEVTSSLNTLLSALPNAIFAITAPWRSNTAYRNAIRDGVLAASDQSRVRFVPLLTNGAVLPTTTGPFSTTDAVHVGGFEGHKQLALQSASAVASAFIDMCAS